MKHKATSYNFTKAMQLYFYRTVMIFLTHMLRSRSLIILYSIDSSNVDAQSTPLKVSGLHRHEVMFMDTPDYYFSD